jgi:hypothetical protein
MEGRVLFLKVITGFGIAGWIGVSEETRRTPRRKGYFCSQPAPSKVHSFPKFF